MAQLLQAQRGAPQQTADEGSPGLSGRWPSSWRHRACASLRCSVLGRLSAAVGLLVTGAFSSQSSSRPWSQLASTCTAGKASGPNGCQHTSCCLDQDPGTFISQSSRVSPALVAAGVHLHSGQASGPGGCHTSRCFGVWAEPHLGASPAAGPGRSWRPPAQRAELQAPEATSLPAGCGTQAALRGRLGRGFVQWQARVAGPRHLPAMLNTVCTWLASVQPCCAC